MTNDELRMQRENVMRDFGFETLNLKLETLILLLAAVLRFPILARQSIAFDEGFSLAVSSKPLPFLLKAILSDGVHPPLFYILFKGALALFGTTEFGARFFTAALSILGVAAIFLLGKTLFGRRVGLAAALLLAVNPVHIWLAQEARMYSLLSLLATLNFWFFWQTLHRPRRKYWVGLWLTATLLITTHYFGLLMPAIQFFYLAFRLKKHPRTLIPWTLTQFAAGLVLLPWLIATALRPVKSFGIAFLVRPTPADMLFSVWNMVTGFDPSLWMIALPALAVAAIGIILAWKRPAAPTLLLTLWAFAPVVLVWVVSQQRSFYADRYLSFTIPALMLLIAVGWTQFSAGRKIIIPLMGIFLLANHLFLLNAPTFWKDNWRGAAKFIAAHEQPGDVIVLRSPHIELPFDYYYRGQAERRLATFNLDIYPVAETVGDAPRVWMVMPYTRRPTHYPSQPLTDTSVWVLDDEIPEWQHFVESHPTLIHRRLLGAEIWQVANDE